MGGDSYSGGGGQIVMFFAIVFGGLAGVGLALGLVIALFAVTVGLP